MTASTDGNHESAVTQLLIMRNASFRLLAGKILPCSAATYLSDLKLAIQQPKSAMLTTRAPKLTSPNSTPPRVTHAKKVAAHA